MRKKHSRKKRNPLLWRKPARRVRVDDGDWGTIYATVKDDDEPERHPMIKPEMRRRGR